MTPNQDHQGIRESIRKHEARIADIEWQIRLIVFLVAIIAAVTVVVATVIKLL